MATQPEHILVSARSLECLERLCWSQTLLETPDLGLYIPLPVDGGREVDRTWRLGSSCCSLAKFYHLFEILLNYLLLYLKKLFEVNLFPERNSTLLLFFFI